jgi:DNA-binding NtrC family response regulator
LIVPRNRILVVDDEAGVRFGIRDFLEANRYEVIEAGSCQEAEQLFSTSGPDAALLDYRLPDGSALELLPRLKKLNPNVPVIILTAYGSIELAVRAIKEGADHFLTKPLELPVMRVILRRLLETQRDRQRQAAAESGLARSRVDPFLGRSAAIARLAEDATRLLQAPSPVLIEGETGTGKGVLALWLHHHGPRADEAFVEINCAGLAPELLESELFGHEKGAFTGATSSKPGLLEVANNGTAFLDEIGDVHPQVQAKLLKVIEEMRFRRLGDVRDRLVDVRLISATNCDLPVRVRDGRFRSDLYFRVSALRLSLPPLRERPEDIPVLARELLRRCAGDLGRAPIDLSPDAEQRLLAYSWPGNIRELRNVLERAALLTSSPVLRGGDLRFDAVSAAAPSGPFEDLTLQEMERRHIERALRAEGGHVPDAARRLGIPRSTLYHKLKRHGIDPSKV